MHRAALPKAVKLFIGFISNEIALMDEAIAILVKSNGPIELKSDILDFNFTTYYNKEMGLNLKRKFIIFKKLIKPDNSFRIKILTNTIEKKFSIKGKRRINIDPGYVTLGNLVLFTTKDFYHRIYLGKGIYAETTLYYKNNTFNAFEWSYPDYKSNEYINFFNKVRNNYAAQLRDVKC